MVLRNGGVQHQIYNDLPLGKHSAFPTAYAPELLRGIERASARSTLLNDGDSKLPFVGEDVWNCYELSWLRETGQPDTGMARIEFPCTSRAMVESKSLKL